jgi:hypothetical protein
VIGGDDPLSPEWNLVVVVPVTMMMRIVFGVRVRSEARGSVHMGKSETEYQGKVFKRKAPF